MDDRVVNLGGIRPQILHPILISLQYRYLKRKLQVLHLNCLFGYSSAVDFSTQHTMRTSSLYHEALYHSVKDVAIVVPSSSMSNKVLNSSGTLSRPEADVDIAERGVKNSRTS